MYRGLSSMSHGAGKAEILSANLKHLSEENSLPVVQAAMPHHA